MSPKTIIYTADREKRKEYSSAVYRDNYRGEIEVCSKVITDMPNVRTQYEHIGIEVVWIGASETKGVEKKTSKKKATKKKAKVKDELRDDSGSGSLSGEQPGLAGADTDAETS